MSSGNSRLQYPIALHRFCEGADEGKQRFVQVRHNKPMIRWRQELRYRKRLMNATSGN
jgi:hypothetical protein